ncbi:hypothetical protein ACHWQZ_G017909 [Mnemiopsis leidyi]
MQLMGISILLILSAMQSPTSSQAVPCPSLQPAWFYLTTDTTFPVASGVKVTVKCPDEFVNQGSETLTCVNGINYNFDDEPSCEPQDWTAATKNVEINHDLETTPLQIITNTLLRQTDKVHVYVQHIGTIQISFQHRRFYILSCGDYEFPSDLPAERDKIWTISRTKEALTILCNGVEVLNMVYAEFDKYCTRAWSQSSALIEFRSDDLASDYTKSLSQGACNTLPEYFDSSLTVTETFPVDNLQELDVTLSCPADKLAVGDKVITCFGKSHFFYSKTPACLPQGNCTKLHPAWFYVTTDTVFPVAPGVQITVKCPDGFVNQGSETITCQNEIHYKFDNVPRCEPQDWTAVTKKVEINHDLETTPLQIITNTLLRQTDKVHVYVQHIGTIQISFQHRRFYILSCGDYEFPSDLPAEKDKIWTISRTKEALSILCNGVEVLNMVYAEFDKYCTRAWSQSSALIEFRSDDLASDYTKSLGQGACDTLPEYFDSSLTVTETFPVDNLQELDVTLSCPSDKLAVGDKVITCFGKSHFFYSKTPACLPQGNCTKLHPAWFYVTTDTVFPVAPGVQITVKCPDGFVNQGSETITCQNEINYKFDNVPRCEPQDWTAVTRNVDINHDLEITPFQIITNTLLRKTDKVRIYVQHIGTIQISFQHRRFYILSCGDYEFPSDLPAERDKIWTFSRTKEVLTILCNGVEALNLIYSDWSDSSCSDVWTKEASALRFNNDDLASDYYRNPSGQACEDYNKADLSNLYLSTELPVAEGTEVMVTCFKGYVRQRGDSVVLCSAGNFVYSERPQCVLYGRFTLEE